jgi:hypothetical protein
MATILSPAELAEVREEIEIVMPETARVLYRSAVQTKGGGTQETFTAKPDSDIPAAIGPAKRTLTGGEAASSGNKVDDRMPQAITVPATTEVSARDRIEIDNFGVFDILAVAKQSEAITKRLEGKELL